MKHRRRFWIGALVAGVLAAALALLAAGGQGALAADGVIRVDAGATGIPDGESWETAYTDLQDALDAAASGDQIWVAEGIYRPTEEHGGTGDRFRSFQMMNLVAIYGGFAGTETELGQRDWVDNVTILSGDLGTTGDSSDNSYHVFYHPYGTGLDSSAILDGFTITGGNADLNLHPHFFGGGMFNDGSSPTLTNCTFADNSAHAGGGMVNGPYSSPTLTNCTFSGNSALRGGGIWNYSSGPSLTNCTFSGNSADDSGGGLYNTNYSSPLLANCIFSGNSAGSQGGGMFNLSSSPTLTNCTFSGNSAGVSGGGMASAISSPRLTNCILWGDMPEEIYNFDSTPIVTYSDVQGGYEGVENIDLDPLFVDAANGDFHLGTGSWCIDVGDNYAPNLPSYDFEGDDRILDGNNDGTAIVDMGADEVVYSGPQVLQVEIDIRPDSDQNVINLGSGGVVPVAILTTDEFDATTVRPASVLFAGAAPRRWTKEDVDRDGDLDLLLNFKIQDLVDLDEDSTVALLAGETFPRFGAVQIEGTDSVRIVQ